MDTVAGLEQQRRPLFGGAFSAFLPPGSLDVSELRQVPDNQEVFVHPGTDQSIIVELLEYQTGMPDEAAIRYHFEDVVGTSGGAEVLSQESLAPHLLALEGCSSAWSLTACQLVAKFNEEAKNKVRLHLTLLRLPQYGTDVLLTFNDPTCIQCQFCHVFQANGRCRKEFWEKSQIVNGPFKSPKQQCGPRNRGPGLFPASVDSGALPHLCMQSAAP